MNSRFLGLKALETTQLSTVHLIHVDVIVLFQLVLTDAV